MFWASFSMSNYKSIFNQTCLANKAKDANHKNIPNNRQIINHSHQGWGKDQN